VKLEHWAWLHLLAHLSPSSRFFWVSSLAYPNLLGTKGYVVVVVVYLSPSSHASYAASE
jgi:hypothetical protein